MVPHGIIFVLSLVLTLLFFLYGFNHYYLLYQARRYQPPVLDKSPDARPSVSIHLPIYNEKYVVRRLMSACACMAEAYGIDQVSILILDDSDDDTVSEVDTVAEEYIKKHFHIEVVRRENRQGFKAGALQAALEKTPEAFIAIFDADFTPPADFLIRTLPYFMQDECLGIVQSRWGHLNRNFNILTRGTAILIDIHFVIEQAGRYAAGLFQNFNGSGGVLRKKAVLEAGGWQADTLAEDLDLSYRMQLLGYRVLYLKDLQSPGEIPPTMPSFKQQQSRWACGTLRAAKKLLPLVLPKREIELRQRLLAFIHLTGYFIHPMMTFSFVLCCLSTFLNLSSNIAPQSYRLFMAHGVAGSGLTITMISLQNLTWLFLIPPIILCTLSPWISAVTTLRVQKLSLFHNLTSLLVLIVLGFGISLNNTLGVARALFSDRAWEWTRTPKYADLQSKASWRTRKYQINLDRMWLPELVFACLGALSIGSAIWHSNFPALLILIPFTIAYAFVSLFTLLQSRRKKALSYA